MNDHDRIQALWQQIVRIENTYVHYARQHGLTIAEFAILYECTWQDGLSPSEICRTWSLSKQLVRQGAGKLIQKEAICIEPDPKDRRMVRLSLTPRGRRQYSDLVFRAAEVEENAMRTMGLKDFEVLHANLRRFGDLYEEGFDGFDGFDRKGAEHGTD